MKKVGNPTPLASLASVALASCLAAPTHAVVPLGNPLAAGDAYSLFIANPVSNPTIVIPSFAPQNVVRGMGDWQYGELGSIPPAMPAPHGAAQPFTVGCRAASPPPPIGDYPLALVVQVAASLRHGVALRSNGDVVTFGTMDYGDPYHFNHCPTYFSDPVPLNAPFTRRPPVWAVAAGEFATYALQGTSQSYSFIKAWGSGPVGNGKPSSTEFTFYAPECVRNNVYPLGTCLYPVVSVAGGEDHAAAVTTDGKVHTWGRNDWAQLGQTGVVGNERNYALAVLGIDNVVSVAASRFVTFALKQDGTVWCWGNFEYEAILQAPPSCGVTPRQVPSLSGVTSIAAGRNHALAITVDGHVWGWGHNTWGAVGDPTVTFTVPPVLVSVPGFAVAIAAGTAHSLARTADGKTWAWGNNAYGQLGDGTHVNRVTPVQVLL